MGIQVRAKRNVKYYGKMIAAGTVTSISKEDLLTMSDVFLTLEEEQAQEKEKEPKPQISEASERHYRMKEKILEADRIRREEQAFLLEKQAEEQSLLAKASAARLRSKTKNVAVA